MDQSIARGAKTMKTTGRRAPNSRLVKAVAVVVAGLLGATAIALAAGTQVYNPQTRQWINYDRTKAYQYYKRHKQVPESFRRQVVKFRTAEQPGTIIIDGNQHFLYLVQPGQQAIRYGIGVGRDGFGWAGVVRVGRTAEWPTWTPPAEMVARDPNARKWASGQPGGPDNPLGARALYLYEGDHDTIYRIHGTPEPWTIGLDVSSGCIRMNNDDIVDLHSRVKVGAKVIVLMQGAALFKGV
jgi:lipoprotein-anchoring transpeptidase ErfK/SrfK